MVEFYVIPQLYKLYSALNILITIEYIAQFFYENIHWFEA